MAEKRWIPETLFDDLGFRMTYQVERVLYEMQTEHQHLVLFGCQLLGEVIANLPSAYDDDIHGYFSVGCRAGAPASW